MSLPTTVQLSFEDYITLRELALQGAPDKYRLQQTLDRIESDNDFATYRLWVRWVNADERRVPTTRFPEEWPPRNEVLVVNTNRPIARSDVLAAIEKAGGAAPTSIYVTKDLAKTVGWATLDQVLP